MNQTGYRVVIHQRALSELHNLTPRLEDDLRDRIQHAASEREPTSQPYADHLHGYPDLFKIRLDGYRCICRLDTPELQVLLIGKRRRVYDRLDTAVERAEDGGGY